jgi:aminoglycoside 6'-N-acetyltransferase I
MAEIRILGPGDGAVLQNVAPDVFDHALDPALVAEFLHDPRHHLAVAIDQDQVVGFASGVHYVHPDKTAELFINEVAVAPTHHRRGIGKAVVSALLDHATRLGCREAWVLTDRGNEAAMRLYASTGGDPGPHDHVMFTYHLDQQDRK